MIANYANADRGDFVRDDAALNFASLEQTISGQRKRDVGAGDRSGARAAVRLQHVAIERDCSLAKSFACRPRLASCDRSSAESHACALTVHRGRLRAAFVVAWRAAASSTPP